MGFMSAEVRRKFVDNQMYGNLLRRQYRAAIEQKLKGCHNMNFRKHVEIPPWVSPRKKFVLCWVLSFGEILQKKMFSLVYSIKLSNSSIVETMMHSDSSSKSRILVH